MSRLVPKLRFKAFSGAWKKRKLREVCEIYNGSTPKTIKPEYWNGEINWITPAEMGNNKYVNSTIRKITKKGLKESNTRLLPIDSIVLSCRAPIGYVAINKEEMSFNQGCKGVLAKNIDYEFLYYLLNLSKIKLENLGSGNTFKEISTNNLKEMKVSFPKDPKEQQKIASCLSSLDALIEAQNKKVSALKQHKKGLMQQLFPAEGEREPKLRFKAFSGEWEEKKLSMVSNITTGGSNREDSTKNDGEYTFFDRSEDVRTSARYLFDDEAIIIAGEGQKFTPKYYKGKFDLHQRTYAILELQIIGKFLYYYIDKYKDYFLQNAVGSTVKSLRLPMFQQMPVLLPILTEQQKIANTLSTLDSLIEAQNQQINHLKQHKKGLMQQLFVSSEVGV